MAAGPAGSRLSQRHLGSNRPSSTSKLLFYCRWKPFSPRRGNSLRQLASASLHQVPTSSQHKQTSHQSAATIPRLPHPVAKTTAPSWRRRRERRRLARALGPCRRGYSLNARQTTVVQSAMISAMDCRHRRELSRNSRLSARLATLVRIAWSRIPIPAAPGDDESQKEALLGKLDTWCRWCKIRAHRACGVFGDSRNRRLLPRELIDSDMAVVCSTSCARRYLKAYGDRSAFPFLCGHLVAVVNGLERSASNVIVPSCSAAPPAEKDVLLDDEAPEKAYSCSRRSRRTEEVETARLTCIRKRSPYYRPTGQILSKALPEVDLLIVQAYVEERMWEICGREDKSDCWYRMALVVRDRLNSWDVDAFFSKYAEKEAGTCGCYSVIGAYLTKNVRWMFDLHPRAWNVSRRNLRPVRSDAMCVSKMKTRFSCARRRAQLLLKRTELNHSRPLSKVDMALITLFGKIGTQVAESERRGVHNTGG